MKSLFTKDQDTIKQVVTEVAVYARVSSEDQQERETIETQIEFGTKYCDLHRFNIYDWYKDDGVSGKIPLEERPDGKRLIEDAKAGKIKLVLIYNIKRLGRTARDILNSVYQLEKYGVKIRSMTEPFDTGDPHGRFILTILAGVAELDRETTLDTMWHGANRAARKGKWLGGIVPYGYYINDEGYPEINEYPIPGKPDMTEAGVIRMIFHLIANLKYTTIQVADYLNALGIPTSYSTNERKIKRGKRKVRTAGIWTPSRINFIVRNPMYKGSHDYGKRATREREIINRKVPAIVSESIWDTAQEVLTDNQLDATKNRKTNYLLRSIIKCGECGLTYIGQAYRSTNRENRGYYVCGGKVAYRGPLQGKCKAKNIPQDWIEEVVWNECVAFIRNPGEALNELAKSMEQRKSQKDELLAEKEMILRALQEKDGDRSGILDLYRKKIITASDVEKQLMDITKEKAELEGRINQINTKIAAEENFVTQFETVDILLDKLREKIQDELPYEVRREIVKALVKEIRVDTIHREKGRPQGVVSVQYSFASVVSETVKDLVP